MTTEINLTTPTEIRWPAKYLPANAHVFVSNEIEIPASPEAIWACLIRAEGWPDWYPNARHIHFRSISGPDMRARARFSWSRFGAKVFSQVLEFEPCTRIAWDSHGIGMETYQAWVLTRLPGGKTHVLMQETQFGWLAQIGKLLMPSRMHKQHQIWLECLSGKAQAASS